MKLEIEKGGPESTHTQKCPSYHYHRIGMGQPVGSVGVPTREAVVGAVGHRIAAPVLRALQFLCGRRHPDLKADSMLGVPVVSGKGKTRYAIMKFEYIVAMKLVVAFWNPEFLKPVPAQYPGDSRLYRAFRYNCQEFRQLDWAHCPNDITWYRQTYGSKPNTAIPAPELVWPLDREEPFPFEDCFKWCLIRGAPKLQLQEIYNKIYGPEQRKEVLRYRQRYPCGYSSPLRAPTKWWLTVALILQQVEVPVDENDREMQLIFQTEDGPRPVSAKNWISGYRDRAENQNKRLPQDDDRPVAGFRRARPGDLSYEELIDWLIILFRSPKVGPCGEQVLGRTAQATRRQGFVIDCWPMPTEDPDEVTDALDRLREGRDGNTERRDVGSDEQPSVDANVMTNRFRNIPLPAEVHPWAYQPENWEPCPEMDENLMWQLVPFFTQVSTGDLSGGPGEDVVMEEDAEEEEQMEMSEVTLDRIEEITKDFKKSKDGAPSTMGGDTTVGTGTTRETGLSSGSRSTAGTEGTMQS